MAIPAPTATERVETARAALVDGLRNKAAAFEASPTYQNASDEQKAVLDKTLAHVETVAQALDNFFNSINAFRAANNAFKEVSLFNKVSAGMTLYNAVTTLLTSLESLRSAMTQAVYPKQPPTDSASLALQGEIDDFVSSQLAENSALFALIDSLPAQTLQQLISTLGSKVTDALKACHLDSLDASSPQSVRSDLKFYFEIMMRQLMSPQKRAALPARDWNANNPAQKLEKMSLSFPDGEAAKAEDLKNIVDLSKIGVEASPAPAANPTPLRYIKTVEQVTLTEISAALNSKIKTLSHSNPSGVERYQKLKQQVDELSNELSKAMPNDKAYIAADTIKRETVKFIYTHTDIEIPGVAKPVSTDNTETAVSKYQQAVSPAFKHIPFVGRKIAAFLAGIIGAVVNLWSSKNENAKSGSMLEAYTRQVSPEKIGVEIASSVPQIAPPMLKK